jgi:DNA-binding transcriptional LysR family regulator
VLHNCASKLGGGEKVGTVDWDDFRFLQAIAQTGSVRSAGELLHVHGSTVARRLDQLEQRIGARLFARTPQGMEMTAAAAGVMDALQQVATELERVERCLQGDAPANGPVGLALPRSVALRMVIPTLADLYRLHPDLAVAVRTEPALPLLQSGAVDIALCVTDDPPQDLIGRPLGTLMACAYSAPGHLDESAPAADSPTARWVGPDDPASLSATVRARYFPTLPQGLRVDEPELVAAALLAGFGVGLLSCYVGDESPGLTRAGAVEPVREGEVWLFTRPDSRGVPRIQAVSEFLQSVFAGHRAVLEGGRPRRSAA